MPSYDRNADLPDRVKDALPAHAQEIYRKAFNNAWEEYDKPQERQGGRSQEETAHAVAWSAVKKEYEKNEKTGKWVSKDDGHSGKTEKEGAHSGSSSSRSSHKS